ncbi:MAG: hypothetical protein GTO02_20300 [Candidatus Dadabacteria bacterium]|nr:hypothetical protein [Candidatus Dadabacteria bacterium]
MRRKDKIRNMKSANIMLEQRTISEAEWTEPSEEVKAFIDANQDDIKKIMTDYTTPGKKVWFITTSKGTQKFEQDFDTDFFKG